MNQETRLNAIEAVITQGPFAANWESLKAYKIPQWYQDEKFGIFIHWGLYAVPAFANEWYPRHMYIQSTPEYKHHLETYGEHTKFGYKDFIPMFKAEKYNPEAWAELFKKSGARFIMPVAEHHDGFAMYDSDVSQWTAAKMGPKRDLIGDLAKAVKDKGMIFAASSHRAEHWWFFDGGMKFPSDVQDPNFTDFYGPAKMASAERHDSPEWKSKAWQPAPDKAFLDDWLIRCCEIVDKYRPQVLWFDWWIEQKIFEPYLQKFAAYYYNRGAEWGLGVAINHKYDSFPEGVAVFDIERGQLNHIRAFFWQNDTSLSKNSWGYISRHDYKPLTWLIQDLVDIVSKNGALLLNVGPKPDGTIPEEEQKMLLEIGKWLSVNGEAIYGTRPWRTYGEGPTEVPEGAFTDTTRKAFTPEDIRFTTKDDVLYAIVLAWPDKSLTIKSLANEPVKRVNLLGHGPLEFRVDTRGLHIAMPLEKPCEHAFALAINQGQ
jgi:alpha-L-fucosidase